jgi:hypothetical protein
MKEANIMAYSIRYTRATNHIQGIPERTTGPATDNSATTGVVGYYATSACAALTRSGHRMGFAASRDDLAAILDQARTTGGRNLCKRCERAALRALADAASAAPTAPATPTYATALAALPTGTDVQIYTAMGHTVTGKIAGTGTDGAMIADDITGNRRQVPYDTVASFEHFDHDTETWADPIADAEPTPADRERTYELAYRTARDTADHAARITDDAADSAAEAAYERYRGAADTIDRCLIFGCEATTDPHRAYCHEHDTTDDADDTACGERTTVDGIGYPCINRGEHVEHNTRLGAAWRVPAVDVLTLGAAYTDARQAYMRAADRLEETGAESDQLAADDAWGTFIAAADAAGMCRAFTCYAEAEPGATECQHHRCQHDAADSAAMAADALAGGTANPECSCSNGLCEDCAREYRAQLPADHHTVTARLDHTEPGKAIAIIATGHGREHTPQAWLAHERGSWLLVDDYDGDTLNVKGPDAERAVHAWAALLGIRIDTLTVDVEYAGGPVSPPVPPAPDARGADLVWARDSEEVNVFHAHGRAHDYRLTEHYDGANLVVSLRGKGGPIVVYRRRYTTRAGGRRAAQAFEHRHGPMNAPAQ